MSEQNCRLRSTLTRASIVTMLSSFLHLMPISLSSVQHHILHTSQQSAELQAREDWGSQTVKAKRDKVRNRFGFASARVSHMAVGQNVIRLHECI